MNKELLQILKDDGYFKICIRDGKLCGIQRFIYTVGVCIGLDAIGYEKRFCFDTEMNARLFLMEWDGTWQPVVGDDGCTAIK